MNKHQLKGTSRFHLVSPSEIEGLMEYAEWLEAIIHNPCAVWESDGEDFLIEIRQLVERLNGLKIEVYSNEHAPPHFHVVSPNIDASFDIENCTLLHGKISGSDLKKIVFWFKHAKPALIEAWNSTRPTNCVVGKYAGT